MQVMCPGVESPPREWEFRLFQHHQREFLALGGEVVAGAIEPLDPGGNF